MDDLLTNKSLRIYLNEQLQNKDEEWIRDVLKSQNLVIIDRTLDKYASKHGKQTVVKNSLKIFFSFSTIFVVVKHNKDPRFLLSLLSFCQPIKIQVLCSARNS